MLFPVALALAWSHATFKAYHAREIAHRWRPVKIPLDDTEIVFNTERLRKYTRALIELREDSARNTFGVCAVNANAITLYVLRASDEGKTHVITAVLWTDEAQHGRKEATRELSKWHRRTFKAQLVAGKELERSDRLLF